MEQFFDLTNFTAGELSPRLKGRIDYNKYFNGCASLINMVPMPQGGVTRRPGSAYVAAAFDQAHKIRLRRFTFSTLQSYMLEFGQGYVRINKNDGQVLNVQAVTSATNNGAGLIRLALASAVGLYTGNIMSVSGVGGTHEATGTWTISNVIVNQAVLGTANNGADEVRLQVASTAHFIPAAQITVAGVGGTLEANGNWRLLIVDATHIDLQGSVFASAWTSGGTVTGNDATLVDLQGSAFVHAYTGGGSTSTVVQVPLPYQAGDLDQLYFTQSDDTLYLFHPNYPTAALTRSSHTAWAYASLIYRDGPYLDINVSSTTLTLSGSFLIGGRQVLRVGEDGLTIVLNPGVSTRSVTFTASSTFGINATPTNAGQGFLPSDAGRHLRVKMLASWCWLIIEQVTSPTVIVATIQPTVAGGAWGNLDGAGWLPNTFYPVGVVISNGGHTYQCVQAGFSSQSTGPTTTGTGGSTEVADSTCVWNFITGAVPSSTTFWQLGKWTAGTYPFVGTFWQQRLMMLGTSLQPNAIEGSVTGDFTNMAPTQQDGTTTDSNAFSFVISDDQVNAIEWVKAAGSAQAAQLAIGTVGEEHILQAYSTAQPLTPTNVQVYSETAIGTAPVEPLRVGKSLLFVDRPGRKLIEWTFLWQVNGYDPQELSEPSEHITQSGVVQMIYAQAPHRLVILLLANGQMVFAAYNKAQQVFAPARQILGGDYFGGPPIVESIEVMPSQDTSYDEIWLSVLRTVENAPVRTIEVLSRWFENATIPQENAVFLDCSLSTVLPTPAATITGIIDLANVATAVDAPASFGGTAVIEADANVFGAGAVGQIMRINGGLIKITGSTAPNLATGLVLRGLTSLAPAAAGSWSLAPLNTAVTGLDYLDGETVGILGDGADFGTAVVTGGSVPLASAGASMVTAGLPYFSGFVTMPFEPQRAAAAASSGKLKRVDTMWMRFFESLGCNFGLRSIDDFTFATFDTTEPLLTRSAAMAMGQAPTLFSGARELRPQGGWDREAQMLCYTMGPLPLTVLSIFARGDVADLPGGR